MPQTRLNGVLFVFRRATPFEIFNAVVAALTVFVIDFWPLVRLVADKGDRDKTVNEKLDVFSRAST